MTLIVGIICIKLFAHASHGISSPWAWQVYNPVMKHQIPRDQALGVAGELVHAIQDVCLNMAIAVSLCRLKPEVGDVEILYSPQTEERPDGLFTKAKFDLAAERIEQLLRRGIITKRLSEKGTPTWGPLNKLSVHVKTGIPVDIFCEPDPENWARSLLFRTGPAAFNIRIIRACADQGVKLHAYGKGLTRNGEVIPCGSEKAIFAVAKMNYLPPEKRR